jgi:hypothetical protein
VPIQTALVEPSLMKPEDIAWLDDYHKEVRGCVGLGAGGCWAAL